ncbi:MULTISPECIES: MaoC family dehydratase [Novosphingobium]|uniref:Acyl dehydratase n=1 Tax=Novosphingobium mathurense TaxID=428990 RepID=A0A1U6HV10_9SPHN|nr:MULTISPECIES: MaoC family dehydratase [Novosphingobium]CDO37832.1 nodN-like protein (modular protein) [Novosphingobium sp. KN65.2]SLJ99606.1 Acyl dehydratase [Novosphingobium mathurense]
MSTSLPLRVDYRDLHKLVGNEIGLSRWIEIDQSRIDRFADVTEDHQWIHVDRARAKSENGGTIAHGFLMLSLVPALTLPMLEVDGLKQIFNYGADRLRFLSPVRCGERIRARQEVIAVDRRASGTLLRSRISMEKPDGTRPVFTFESLSLMVPLAASDETDLIVEPAVASGAKAEGLQAIR